jgi:hypothetical protein
MLKANQLDGVPNQLNGVRSDALTTANELIQDIAKQLSTFLEPPLIYPTETMDIDLVWRSTNTTLFCTLYNDGFDVYCSTADGKIIYDKLLLYKEEVVPVIVEILQSM